MRSTFLLPSLGLLAPAIALLTACSHGPALTNDGLSLGSETGSSAALTALEAFPFLDPGHTGPTRFEVARSASGDAGETFVSRFSIVDGDGKGGFLRLERSAAAEPPGAWKLRWFLIPGGKSKAQTETLIDEKTITLSDKGGALLVSSIDHAEGVVVEFEPSMVTFPASLAPSSEFEQRAAMRLPLIKQPDKTREKGDGVMTLTLAATQPVQIGGDRFDAVRVREVFRSDLSLAKATRTTDHWFAPGIGLVARRWEEEVKSFGLTVRKRAQAIVVLPP